MIYKSSFKFKQCEKRLGEDVAIEKRGKKIVVNDLTFYVNKEKRAVEETTGLYVPLKCDDIYNADKDQELIEIESELISIYDKIVEHRNKRIKEGRIVKNLKIWEDK